MHQYYDKKYLLKNIEYELILSKYYQDLEEKKLSKQFLEKVITGLSEVEGLEIRDPELEMMYTYHLIKIYITLERFSEAKEVISLVMRKKPGIPQEKIYYDKIVRYWQDYKDKMKE